MDARDIMYKMIDNMFNPAFNPFVKIMQIDGVDVPYLPDTAGSSSNLQRYGRGDDYAQTYIWFKASALGAAKELTGRHEFLIDDRVYYLGRQGVVKDDGYSVKVHLTMDPSEGPESNDLFGSSSEPRRSWI